MIPAWALRTVGAVHSDTRELVETAYQFTRPFVLDSTRSQAWLGLEPTPLHDGVRATVEWWRAHATA